MAASEEDDIYDRKAAEADAADERARRKLKPVIEIYERSVTSLWFGNGGASVAVLSFIAASEHNGIYARRMLISLAFFSGGLVSLGVGTIIFLINNAQKIRAYEDAGSLLDVPSGMVKRRSEEAGLSMRDPRTIFAIVSGLMFVTGCVVGFFELAICPS